MQPKKELNIFLYMDYREYLRDRYDAGFSLRAFAKRAGFKSHNFLKMVMKSERNLTEESIQKFIKGLNLSAIDANYFKKLVAHNQATGKEERQKNYEMILQAQEMSKVSQILRDQYAYYKGWYHPVVRELVSHDDFQENPSWIARKISPSITPSQAKESLDLLQRLGLVNKQESGNFEQTEKLLTTGPEVTSHTVANYHRKGMDLAKSSIDRVPRDKRDISSLTLGVSNETIQILKRRIQLFRQEVMKLISTDKKTEAVVQLNLQLFPLTSLEEEMVEKETLINA
jgi:uncharacterized protein (TIGR02147 family)